LLEAQPGDDLAVFVVWSDQVGGSTRHVPGAAKLMSDPRARHYWDAERVVGQAYRILRTPKEQFDIGAEAWDVWLLFDRQATWPQQGQPPRPVWWEHQLRNLPSERRLEPKRFASKAAELRRP
jgi:hypothetical protein